MGSLLISTMLQLKSQHFPWRNSQTMAALKEVSHGRGGAGNINADETQYVDGEIVRQGVEGTHGDGAFSTGRGGTYHYFTLLISS